MESVAKSNFWTRDLSNFNFWPYVAVEFVIIVILFILIMRGTKKNKTK